MLFKTEKGMGKRPRQSSKNQSKLKDKNYNTIPLLSETLK